MALQSFYGINKSNFTKVSGITEIYAVINPNSDYKNFIPMGGYTPLTPVVADQSLLKFVIFGEKFFLIKKLQYVIKFQIDDFSVNMPLPENYLYKNLSKKEKLILAKEAEDKKFSFVQLALIT
jgi:hypothetical protein